MSNECSGVQLDLQNRIAELTARIHTYDRMSDQLLLEKERLQCLLDNLDTSEPSPSHTPAPTTTQVFNQSTSLASDGPWM